MCLRSFCDRSRESFGAPDWNRGPNMEKVHPSTLHGRSSPPSLSQRRLPLRGNRAFSRSRPWPNGNANTRSRYLWRFEGSSPCGACAPSAGTDFKFHSKIADAPALSVRMRKFSRTSPTCGSPTIGALRHGISRPHPRRMRTTRSPFSRVVTTASRGGLHGGMGARDGPRVYSTQGDTGFTRKDFQLTDVSLMSFLVEYADEVGRHMNLWCSLGCVYERSFTGMSCSECDAVRRKLRPERRQRWCLAGSKEYIRARARPAYRP